jgi:hypothetical protein
MGPGEQRIRRHQGIDFIQQPPPDGLGFHSQSYVLLITELDFIVEAGNFRVDP